MWIFKPSDEEIEKRSTCKSCGAAIVWSITMNGSRAPINAPFTMNERKKFKIQSGVEVEIVAVSNNASHFATCPQAQQFKRRK